MSEMTSFLGLLIFMYALSVLGRGSEKAGAANDCLECPLQPRSAELIRSTHAAPHALGQAAGGDTSRISMRVEGPTTAEPGEVLSYRLIYDVHNVPGTDVIVFWSSPQLQYISAELTSGNGHLQSSDASSMRWSLERGAGTLELRIRVPATTELGQFFVRASEPGTAPAASNAAVTRLRRPGQPAPPATGAGLAQANENLPAVGLLAALAVLLPVWIRCRTTRA